MRILTGSFWLVTFALTMAKAENNVEALREVSMNVNQFSTSLFHAVIKEKSGNLIMSPLSAGIVLAMAAFGAREKTESQFRTVLHLSSPDNFTKSGYQALIDNLNKVHENKLILANKIFIAKNFMVNSTFKDLTQTYFRSDTQTIDFVKSLEAVNIINSWVKQNTNNLIQDIINTGDIDDSTALILINAVYFKGQWKNKFNPDYTKNMPFYVTQDTVKHVPTMFRQGTYKYGELTDLDAKFVVIPYKGDELSMVIILPNKFNGLTELERKLQTTNLTDILNQGFEREVQLYLPKFKVESKIELNDILKNMGLIDAFTPNANFSGISDEKLMITKVVQKAFIEVNEEGSEAAAATGIFYMKMSLIISLDFAITRPFFYYIIKDVHDKKSGIRSVLSLFSGYVNEPKI